MYANTVQYSLPSISVYPHKFQHFHYKEDFQKNKNKNKLVIEMLTLIEGRLSL